MPLVLLLHQTLLNLPLLEVALPFPYPFNRNRQLHVPPVLLLPELVPTHLLLVSFVPSSHKIEIPSLLLFPLALPFAFPPLFGLAHIVREHLLQFSFFHLLSFAPRFSPDVKCPLRLHLLRCELIQFLFPQLLRLQFGL